MGSKIKKFIKYVVYTVVVLLVGFVGMVVYEMKSAEKKDVNTNIEDILVKEYTKEELLQTEELCWSIITETEKALNNLLEISAQYDNGQIGKNDLYTLADKVYKFSNDKASDLRSVNVSSDTEYKKLCREYITTTASIADKIKIYLDENKQQALTDAKDYITYNQAVTEKLVTERITYLEDMGLSKEDIQAITSIE